MLQLLRTKIVCTIGPASREPELLAALIEAGMDVARLNFSHGEQAFHAETIARIRAASAAAGKPVAILGDLQGPKLRVGVMQEGGVPITEGETLALTTEHITGAPGRVPVQYELLPEVVEPGDRILIDDGLLELTVTAVAGPEITTRVITGGVLNSNKGLNLPRAALSIPAITEKDREDLGVRGRAGPGLDRALLRAHGRGGVGSQGLHPHPLRVRPPDAGNGEDREARSNPEHRRDHRGSGRYHGGTR